MNETSGTDLDRGAIDRLLSRGALLVALLVALACAMIGCTSDFTDEVETDEVETVARASQAFVPSCGDVPSSFINDDEGCDCPGNGDTSCDPDCATSNGGDAYCGCDYCYPEQPPGPQCGMVPDEYVSADDGCDCPADGDTNCDPDCAVGTGQGTYCGCDYCYPEQPPEGTGEQCWMVPDEYLDVNDGCDCAANGDTSCDPDCADGNGGDAYCGCDYCYPEEAPTTTEQCSTVPAEYLGINDGCDCPADGSTSCDPDCELGTGEGTYCGCDYCHPETPPSGIPGASNDHDPGEDPFTAPGSNGTNSCATATAHRTLNGGGGYITPNNYDASGCWRGHIVDLNDYDARFESTVVAFNEARPTTASSCGAATLVVQVWRRNSNGSRTYLGQNRRTGEWRTDPWGGHYCVTPAVRLERTIAGFTHGDDYRIAVRAHTHEIARRRVVVSTVRRAFPATPLSGALELQRAFDNLARFQAIAASDPRVQAFQRFRASSDAAAYCRADEIRIGLLDLMSAGLVKFGVSSTTANNLMTRHRAIHAMTCTATTFSWTQFRSDITNAITLTDSMMDALVIRAGSLENASLILDRMAGYTLAALAQECGTNADTLTAFIADGVAPNGQTGSQLLYGTCGTTPSAVSGAIGIGSLPTSIGQQIETCMEDMVAENDICSDPRAQGSPDAAPTEPECTPEDPCEDITEGEELTARDRVVQELTDSMVSEIELAAFVDRAKREQQSIGARMYEIVWEAFKEGAEDTFGVPGPEVLIPDPYWRTVYEVADFTNTIVETVTDVLSVFGEQQTQQERIEYWENELEEQQDNSDRLCRSLGSTAPPQCDRRCPEFDFGNVSGFYATTRPDGAPREVNEVDRVNHCMCKFVGERLTGSSCETAEDRERQECLRNPDEPNGAPKPHCWQYLQPMDLDMTVLRTRMCEKIYPNCNANSDYLTPDRTCGCGNVPLSSATRASLCPNANVTDCGPDSMLDLKTCQCQGEGTGAPAFGTQGPGCLLDPANFGANVRPMLAPRPNVLMTDLLPTSTGTLPVIRTAPGYQPFATSALQIADFPRQLSSTLKVKVDFPAELANRTTGRTLVNVSVLSASRSRANLINQPIGVIAHSSLQAGALNNVALTIPTSVRDRLATAEIARDDVHFIFVNDTATNYPITPGIGALELGGSLRPSATLSPTCERPGIVGPRPVPVVTPEPLTNPLVLTVPVGQTAVRWPFDGL